MRIKLHFDEHTHKNTHFHWIKLSVTQRMTVIIPSYWLAYCDDCLRYWIKREWDLLLLLFSSFLSFFLFLFFFFFSFLSNLLRMLIAGKRLVLLYRSSPTETFFIDELSVFKLHCSSALFVRLKLTDVTRLTTQKKSFGVIVNLFWTEQWNNIF